MPEALISRITSRGPGVGSGNSLSSSLRSPRNTTPFMLLLVSQCDAMRGDAEARGFQGAASHLDVADLNGGLGVGIVGNVSQDRLRVRGESGLEGIGRVEIEVAHRHVCRG